MYLNYVDESGVPENASTTHFVLIGLAIRDTDWKSFERQVAECKRPYGLLDTEVHAAWMARRYLEQERIPDFDKLSWTDRRNAVEQLRKQHLLTLAACGTKKRLKEAQNNYRRSADYTHLGLAERRQVMQRLADLIGSWRDARLFAEVVDKRYLYGQPTIAYPPFEHAFTEVVQRYEYFLRHRGNAINESLLGIIVQDNNETVARKLTEMMRRFHRQGTRWTNIDHILETPLFVDSHLTSMVQMADLCGYVTRRFFENGETDLFDRIYGRFDRTNKGVVGIRHYTAPGCGCRVCTDHT
jgi:hypothetical protein